jgi:hypothetical protein
MKSPTIKKEDKFINFAEALQKVLDGERVTREEWGDEGEYGLLLDDGFLGIRHEGKLHSWKLHESDILAEDWYVI